MILATGNCKAPHYFLRKNKISVETDAYRLVNINLYVFDLTRFIQYFKLSTLASQPAVGSIFACLWSRLLKIQLDFAVLSQSKLQRILLHNEH